MVTLYDLIWSVVYDPKAALNLGNVILVVCGRRRFTMRTEAQFRPAPSTRQPRGEVAGQLGIGMHHFLSWFYARRADQKHTYSEREQRYSLVSIYGKKPTMGLCPLLENIPMAQAISMALHKWSGGNRIRQIDEAWPPSLCRCLKKNQCLHKIVSIIMTTKSEMKSGSINHENTMKYRLRNGNSHAMRAKQWWRGVLGLALRHEDCKIEKRCRCVQLRLADQAGYQHEPWPLLWVTNQGRGWPPCCKMKPNGKASKSENQNQRNQR